MKVELWCFISDQGDGSAYPRFFATEEEAETEAEKNDVRFCEDVVEVTLNIDRNGKLIPE